MYLSRVRLNDSISECSQLGRVLQKSSYGMHSLLWDLFDQGERFLFREERSNEQLQTPDNRPLYYVLSQREPSHENPLFDVQTKVFTPALKSGSVLHFKLRANPTVTRKSEGKRLSQRHDVLMDAQRRWLLTACKERGLEHSANNGKGNLKKLLLGHADYNVRSGDKTLQFELEKAMGDAAEEWLRVRGAKNGFEVSAIQCVGYRWHALPEKHRQAGFSSVDYDGVIHISDPELFLRALCSGLGPSKAFGCGLMLVRREA